MFGTAIPVTQRLSAKPNRGVATGHSITPEQASFNFKLHMVNSISSAQASAGKKALKEVSVKAVTLDITWIYCF
jgi:hypothetical protein